MPNSYALKLIDERMQRQGRDTSGVLRAYIVTKTSGGAPVAIDPAADYEEMLAAGTMPSPLSPLAGGGFSTSTLRETMRFRGAELFRPGPRAPIHKSALVMRWDTDYIERQVSGGTIKRLLPSGILRAGEVKYSEFWRLNWTTDPPTSSAFPDVEIAGTKVDFAKVPIKGAVPQANVVLWWLVDTIQVSLATLHAVASEHEGRISNATFAGYTVGYLLCQQFDISKVRDEYALVQMRCLYDSLYHHEQKPRNETDGRPKQTSGQAKEVVWNRPFYRMSDFTDIIGAPGSGIITQDQYDLALLGEHA